MKFISFNVNSVRQRLHQLQALVTAHEPAVIGLQETKVQDHEFPQQELEALGYQLAYIGQKTHYGVAVMSKLPILSVQKGFPGDSDEEQKRFLAARLQLPEGKPLTVINGYFPQGESVNHPEKFPNKRRFYQQTLKYLNDNCQPGEPVIVMGDMNISPTDLDIGIGEDNRKRWLKSGKCSFQPEEREWLSRLEQWGLTDTFRHLHPQANDAFSWFDYRSKGFEREPRRGLRIDLIMASQPLLAKCTAAGVDYEIRGMDKPSDHAPVWSDFDL
ncbi:exodeoxyribonuclease III [Pseudomaricurvus sp. HS19]|uniref:exodeoxyribonuclease III n=1 Tax=Pseudomaricurvus sp. HS19 TaxID=2692626 RepID=UPI00136AA592|nr:exodeoxyribonuclease III [Pseudomaricurvus sp. HS19]MYM62443.1 exodeoxyribonuclease III [Pseudomaricurvus sp. HS19]